MTIDISRLVEKRAGKLEEAQTLVSQAEAEDRGLTEAEESTYNALMASVEDIDGRIERAQAVNAQAQRQEQPAGQAPMHTRSGPESAEIGMSDQETRQYSLVRAMSAAASFALGDHRAWERAGLEMEASRAVAEQLGREPQGFFVPFDIQRRDLNVGTASAGGDLVETELLAESFIDLLRNRMMVRQAGATVLSGLNGDIAIPRQTGGATAYWVAESGAPTESQQTVDQVALSPETVGAFTDYSRRLLIQSSIDVEQFVRGDLAAILALAIDLAALHGAGASNEPQGIENVSGIGSVAGGANGAAPTWGNIVDLETEVAIDNADVGRLAYITNARVRGKLKQTEKAASTGLWVWMDRNPPLNGYNAHVTNQVRSNLTKGTGTNLSAIFFGNWADLILAFWSGLDILVDPYTGSTSGTVRIVALQDVDIAVRHAESFAAMLDADTT